MMKSVRKIPPTAIVMAASYSVIFIAVLTAISLDEWATAGNGLKIPNRWLFLPGVLFFLMTFFQALPFLIRKGKAGYGQITLSVLKLLVVFVTESVIDLILDPVWNLAMKGDSLYFALVLLFLTAIFSAAFSEIYGCALSRKKAHGAKT